MEIQSLKIGKKVQIKGTSTKGREAIGQFYGYNGTVKSFLRNSRAEDWYAVVVHVEVSGDASEIITEKKKLEDCIGDEIYIDNGQYCGNNCILKAVDFDGNDQIPDVILTVPVTVRPDEISILADQSTDIEMKFDA